MPTHAEILDRLARAGLSLPTPARPVAAYVPTVRTGNLLFVSGQIPVRDGTVAVKGRIPGVVSIESAQEAARICVLNGLAAAAAALDGDLGRIRRVVRVGVFVQSDDGFTEQPRVANGASELLRDLFGDAGTHARAAVGVNALPLDAAVEVEFLFEVEGP